MGVDMGLTCIFQASGRTSTCLKYLGFLESTKGFVTEQVHGIYITANTIHLQKCQYGRELRGFFCYINLYITICCLPSTFFYFIYLLFGSTVLFNICLDLLNFSSHKSFCMSSSHLSLDLPLVLFLLAHFQKYSQLPLFDLF